MKINFDMIKKIFDGKLKITKKSDKIKLSKYEEYIPMYDIYSEKIYPINKINLYERLIVYHYRFINNEVKNWIENKSKKEKNFENHKKNLEIIDNYELDTLYQTSITSTFKNTKELGLKVSICKRNSFNKHFFSISPYYSRDELINLGLNMKIINENKADTIDIIDSKIHYEICEKISKNDVSFQEILEHSDYIIKNKLISLLSFYSFIGSFFMNNILRNNTITNDEIFENSYYYKLSNKLSNKMINTPKIKKEYFIYRFIWDDHFIRNLKIGELFIDKGFISTTRDPFYSPGEDVKFGIVLAKIKIKPSIFNGLFIENFSLFPKEEEVLLPPNSKLKLISKNENFKYYHTNKIYEKNITKKYEFELVESSKSEKQNKIDSQSESNDSLIDSTNLIKDFDNYKIFDVDNEQATDFPTKIEVINEFIKTYGKETDGNKKYLNNDINITWKPKIIEGSEFRKYKIFYNWFDGTESYDIFYKNKNKDGMFFTVYDEFDYPYLNIEFGEKMVVNNLNKYYYYDINSKHSIDDIDILFLIDLAIYFRYETFQLEGEYSNFSDFVTEKKFDMTASKSVESGNSDEILKDYEVASFSNLYNHSFYDYLKNKNIFYKKIIEGKNLEKYSEIFEMKYGYWKIDKLKSKEIPEIIINKFDKRKISSKNLHEFIIEIIENNFLFYKTLEEYYSDIFNDLYLDVDVSLYLKKSGKTKAPNFFYRKDQYSQNIADKDDNFNLIFNQPIKRII